MRRSIILSILLAVSGIAWSSEPKVGSGTGDGLFAQYYNSIDLSGSVVVSRVDAQINFDWTGSSPDPLVNGTNFSARWTGEIEPEFNETYTFFTRTDDGVRLWVNNVLVVDKWIGQPAHEWSGTVELIAGQKVGIRMEYFQGPGLASAQLSWSSPSRPKQTVPQNRLYSTSGLAVNFPTNSLISPVCLEGLAWPVNGVPAAISANRAAGMFLSETTWFTNVPLENNGPTKVVVKQTGAKTSKTGTISWAALDVTGHEGSELMMLRKNDSLLITAGGGQGGALAIVVKDSAGNPVSQFAGVGGGKIPVQFPTSGVFSVEASINGVLAGKITVPVIDVNLTKPIGCEVGYTREKDVVIAPDTSAADVNFSSGDLSGLTVSVEGPMTSPEGNGTTLLLKALKRGKLVLVSRLGGIYGPVAAAREIDEFTLDIPPLRDAMVDARTDTGFTSVRVHPYVPNVRFSMDLFAHTSTFAGGAKSISVNTSDLDANGKPLFEQIEDPETHEIIGKYSLVIEMPAAEDKYCFRIQAHQSASREVTISNPYNVNGMACKLIAPDPLYIIPENNNEDSLARKKTSASPQKDWAIPFTNIQDIECWSSNARNLAYKVKVGNNMSSFYLLLTPKSKIEKTDRMKCDVKIPRCGDYPGNFWGHLPPETRVEFFEYPLKPLPMIPNPCIAFYPDIKEVQPAAKAAPILCTPHCRDDVPYRTGIQYGLEELSIEDANSSDVLPVANVRLFRLEADGLKDNDPNNVSLDDPKNYPFARTAFPDLAVIVDRPEDGPFDPLTPPPSQPCDDNPNKPPLAPLDKRLGTPVRITARGPANEKINVRLTGEYGQMRVSLTGYYADDDSPKLFKMTTDSSGRAAEVVYLQVLEPAPKADGSMGDVPPNPLTLTVEGMERAWVCASPGATDIDFEQVCAYYVSDKEYTNAFRFGFYVEGRDGSPTYSDALPNSETTPVVQVTNSAGNPFSPDDFDISEVEKTVTFSFKGKLLDPYLTIRPDKAVARPKKIHVYANGARVGTCDIAYGGVSEQAGAFRQYQVEASFGGTASFPLKDGVFRLEFASDDNAFANSSSTRYEGEITSGPTYTLTRNNVSEPFPPPFVLNWVVPDSEPPLPESSPYFQPYIQVRSGSFSRLNWVSEPFSNTAGLFSPILTALEGPIPLILEHSQGASIDGRSAPYTLKAMHFSPTRVYFVLTEKPDKPAPVVLTPAESKTDDTIQKAITARLVAKFNGFTKDNAAAIAVDPGIGFVGTTTTQSVTIYNGKVNITDAEVSKQGTPPKQPADPDIKATVKPNGNAYTIDIDASAKTAPDRDVTKERKLTLTVKTAAGNSTVPLNGGIVIAQVAVSQVDLIDTNSTMFNDASEDPKNEQYWFVDSKIGIECVPNADPKKVVKLPISFPGHPDAGADMPKVRLELRVNSIPALKYDKDITLKGSWAVADKPVTFKTTLKLTGDPQTIKVDSDAALPETNPKKVQANLDWKAEIGDADHASTMDSTETGPCYFTWAKPIWTSVGGQKDTEERSSRIANNEMTRHRMDLMYPAIEKAKTKMDVADALYPVIEKSGLKSNGLEIKRTDHWVLFFKTGPYFGQCGERSRLFERMLVMQGIDGRHVHTFIPDVNWARFDPALGAKGARLKFPSGLQNYLIQYYDNIGRNAGEGCLALAVDTVPFGKPDDAAGFATQTIKRKYIFGKFYGMLTGGNVTAEYDAANEVTGGYGVLLKLSFDKFVVAANGIIAGRYTGWKNDELPRP